MTVVYIIISSNKDFYSEQALISIYSLKKHNPLCNIQVLTDFDSLKLKKSTFTRIKRITNSVSCPGVPDGLTAIQKSRFLKTTLPHILDDDFLYIDNDTIITADISDIESIDCNIGMVYNQHKKDWSEINLHPMLVEYHNKTGIKPKIDLSITDFYNGGIILFKNNNRSKSFFKEWHNLWEKSAFQYGYCKDQPDLWRANVSLNNLITPIDDIWNCQLLHIEQSLQFISKAKILHYFSSISYLPSLFINRYDFLIQIQLKGISKKDEKLIDNFVKEYLGSIKNALIHHKDFPLTPMVVIGNELSRRFPLSDKLGMFLLKLFGINLKLPSLKKNNVK